MLETHDLWHVVTGAGTDKAGECAIHGFYNGQLFPLPVQLAYLARCLLKTALFDVDCADHHMRSVVRGWLLAKRARPLALVDWPPLFARPLRDVRAQFEIPPDGIDGVRLD